MTFMFDAATAAYEAVTAWFSARKDGRVETVTPERGKLTGRNGGDNNEYVTALRHDLVNTRQKGTR